MSLVLPVLDDTNRPFWDGCRAGELRLQRCRPCGHLRYPISPVCPQCLSLEAAWEPVSGRGSIYSFAVFRHVYSEAWRERVPYAVALVELAEGPFMLADVANAEIDELEVGMPVRAVFTIADDEFMLPSFTPERS